MKRTAWFYVLLVPVTIIFLSACSPKPQPPVVDLGKLAVPGNATQALTDVAKNIEEAQKNGDLQKQTEAVQKVADSYAKLGAQFELNDYDKLESVDLPDGFPSELVYKEAKATQSSDSSNESYIDKSLTLKTKASFKDVKDFYKTLFSAAPWKITSQSSESGQASYEAQQSNGISVGVRISSDAYSSLTEISLQYSGSIAQQ
ncbi:hypothetical protein HZA43_03070 [Candidatus Peregrinibacteria bacterium]|nr:hypothetical protein [Candidatus Peregrinibacteria bacterium]